MRERERRDYSSEEERKKEAEMRGGGGGGDNRGDERTQEQRSIPGCVLKGREKTVKPM